MGKLYVKPSPHLSTKNTDTKIMGNVIIALVPTLIIGFMNFGIGALYLVMSCVIGAIAGEFIINFMCKRENTLGDLSAVVTGILLGCSLPPQLPLWMGILGGVFATLVVKGLFGGIGQNFANPAATARIFLMLSFAGPMTTWISPLGVDGVATATPLAGATHTYMDLFIGHHAGCIGEVSAIALIIGGIYLVITGVISITTPAVYIGGVFLFTWLLGGDPLGGILSGAVMICAFFMATDYTTTPVTGWGKVIFSIGLAFLTVVIRVYGNYPEGVSFALLLMNILTPQIDALTHPRIPGGEKQ